MKIVFKCNCGYEPLSVEYNRLSNECPVCKSKYLGSYDMEYLRANNKERYFARKVDKNFVKCLPHPTLDDEGVNTLELLAYEDGMLFGSRVCCKNFEKIESVLTKRYIKLPFGLRLLV